MINFLILQKCYLKRALLGKHVQKPHFTKRKIVLLSKAVLEKEGWGEGDWLQMKA